MRPLPSALLSVVLLPAALDGSPSAAVRASSLTTSISAHGLRMVVSIPNRVYIVGSPVSATVRLTSVSRHSVLLFGYPAACAAGGPNPRVFAVKRNGQTFFPPPVSVPSCPYPLLHALPAGRALSRTVGFALGRPWIMGRIIIVVSPRKGIETPITIRTPMLRVRTRGNAIIPPCRVGEGYPAGGCHDPPNALSVPGRGSPGPEILMALPAAHHAWNGGSIVVKAAIGNPMINDEVPQIVNGQLLVHGTPLAGARMVAIWHYRGGLKTCRGATDRGDIASCAEMPLAFRTRDLDRVTVAVTFTYRGRRYAVETSYRASND